MNRREVCTAPAALTLAAVPMTVAANTGDCIDYDAIRERLGQVAETFSRATAGFPDPMQADEAAAILAITDAEIEEGQAIVEFGLRWGMSLDWLFFGNVTALLIDSRRKRTNGTKHSLAIPQWPLTVSGVRRRRD